MAHKRNTPEVFPLPNAPYTPETPTTKIVGIQKGSPVIIDNGSFECRAGGVTHDIPPVIFRNESRRPRKNEDIPHGSNIGWNVTEEAWRFPVRNAFDHGIMSNMDCQEDAFDYIFYSLGFSGQKRIDVPIIFSEALCNPNYSRNLASELLFECYNVPSIGYYVDSLASFYFNSNKREEISQRTGLIVSAGHSASVVVPFVDGKTIFSCAKRVDVGGMHMTQFTHDLMRLKYPEHRNSIAIWVAHYLKEKHTYYALHYKNELHSYYPEVYPPPDPRVRTIQLPVPVKDIPKPEPSKEEIERKRQDRIAHGKRLKQMADKRREEKLEANRDQIRCMQALLARNLPDTELEEEIVELGYSDIPDFRSELARVSKIVKKAENKPNKPKKIVVEKEETMTEDDIKRINDFESWLRDNKARQQELIDAMEQRDRIKHSWSNRRSAESQNRLHLLNVAADTKADESEFDDWEVYITMQSDKMKEDNERDQAELQCLIDQLEKYAPDELNNEVSIEEYYQLKLGQERVRIPELLFQPPMIGEDQMGLSEAIHSVLKAFAPDVQTALVNNIFLTGGCTNIVNYKKRLEIDIRAGRPVNSSFNIYSAQDTMLDSWKGAKLWSQQRETEKQLLTRNEYEENGPGFMRPHHLSNYYIPTPE